MRHFILILFGFMLTIPVFSQDKSTYEEDTRNRSSAPRGMITTKSRDKGELKGSPYLNQHFMSAEIDGQKRDTRYNAFKDEMEFNSQGTTLILTGKLNETAVVFPNKKYVYVNYKDGKTYVTGYLVELVHGSKSTLYKREKISFIPGVVPKTSYDREIPDEYRRRDDVFLMKSENGEISDFPTNKKRFAKLFGADESKILDFINDSGLSLRNENDLITLFQFINSN
ncbi:MAG: hypothetical protein WDA08_04300 [Weeksellaceae bacterium]